MDDLAAQTATVTDLDVAADGCRWCGVARAGHFTQLGLGGRHVWSPPTMDQRTNRVAVRRANRRRDEAVGDERIVSDAEEEMLRRNINSQTQGNSGGED